MIQTLAQSTRFSLLLLCLSVGLTSCEKEQDKPPLTISEFYACHRQLQWDESVIRDFLMGRWQWVFVGRFNRGVNVENEEKIIEFMPDSTLTITEKDSITQVSSWMVVDR